MKQPDVRTPADTQDQQTTDARSALPPVEFNMTGGTTSNLLTIQDRQGPQNRIPTVSYRVYFLPEAFSPASTGLSTSTPAPAVMRTAIRTAGRKVASLVADVKAPGLGTLLSISDSDNFGQRGYYFCVGVNRAAVEAPVEHMVFSDGAGGDAVAAAPPVLPVVVFISSLESTAAGTVTGVINGINVTFTMTTGFGTTDLVFVDGLFDVAATAVGTTLTTSTPPIAGVAVEHVN